MNIILTISDSHGKNLVFVTDALESYSIDNTIQLISQGKLTGINVVRSSTGLYLRSRANTTKNDNLDTLSISSYKLFSIPNNPNLALELPSFKSYLKLYQDKLENLRKKGEKTIFIDGQSQTTVKHVTEKLSPHQKVVFEAAKHFSIDPYLLGAIIIDEISRAAPIETILDVLFLYFVSWNSSVGIAQIKIETARELIKNGYYNPAPDDKGLYNATRLYLYPYVVQPKHNIFFAAASIREIIDRWMPYIDLSRKSDILGTLYSWPSTMKSNPKPNDRGLKIAGEFYVLAKEILGLQ